jgi:hypothetical protein
MYDYYCKERKITKPLKYIMSPPLRLHGAHVHMYYVHTMYLLLYCTRTVQETICIVHSRYIDAISDSLQGAEKLMVN